MQIDRASSLSLSSSSSAVPRSNSFATSNATRPPPTSSSTSSSTTLQRANSMPLARVSSNSATNVSTMSVANSAVVSISKYEHRGVRRRFRSTAHRRRLVFLRKNETFRKHKFQTYIIPNAGQCGRAACGRDRGVDCVADARHQRCERTMSRNQMLSLSRSRSKLTNAFATLFKRNTDQASSTQRSSCRSIRTATRLVDECTILVSLVFCFVVYCRLCLRCLAQG
jgi:hypothetical protein